MSDTIERTLRESPLFQHLSDSELQSLITAGTIARYQQGDEIIRQGTSAQRLYLIVEGRVRVWTTGPKGDVELKTMGPGAYFGEVSVLSDKDATATVEAKTQQVLCVGIGRDYVNQLVESDDKIRKMLKGVTLARARDTIGKIFK